MRLSLQRKGSDSRIKDKILFYSDATEYIPFKAYKMPIAGDGIRLFENNNTRVGLTLKENKTLDIGVNKLYYEKRAAVYNQAK